MIYVDRLSEYPLSLVAEGARRYGRVWCHMTSDGDNVAELCEFAKRLGLRREWLQDLGGLPHFDLVPSKRRLALRLGARDVDWGSRRCGSRS